MAGRTKRVIGAVLFSLVVIVGAAALTWRFGRWAEIRTDTGELRFCFLGIPYEYVYHYKPHRDILYQAAQIEPPIKSEWLRCGHFPDDGYWYCWHMYREATAWWSVDPRITRLIMDDLADYIRRTRALRGVQESSALTWFVVKGSPSGVYELAADWRERPMVRDYLVAHGFESVLAEK